MVKRIRALTFGGADFSIETTGVPDVLRQAVVSLATLGVCGVIAGSEAPMTLPGRFPFDRLVRYYPLAEINQAAQDSLNGEPVKPILTF